MSEVGQPGFDARRIHDLEPNGVAGKGSQGPEWILACYDETTELRCIVVGVKRGNSTRSTKIS